MKVFISIVLVGFCFFCGWLVVESGLMDGLPQSGRGCILLQNTISEQGGGGAPADANAAEVEAPRMTASDSVAFGADAVLASTVFLGAVDPNTEDPEAEDGFRFQVELSSKGAAMRSVIFSAGQGKGFDDRDHENPKPLKVISPITLADGSEILTMANTDLTFCDVNPHLERPDLQLPLDKLHWKSLGKRTEDDGSQSVAFEAIIKVAGTNKQVARLTKTYRVRPGSYMLDCDIALENLSPTERNVRFDMNGPGGLGREAFRSDMRKVKAGFRVRAKDKGKKDRVISVELEKKKLWKAYNAEEPADRVKKRQLKTEETGPEFLWVASVNKYFAGIVVPLAEEGEQYCDWMSERLGTFYNPDGDKKNDSGDEMLGLDLHTVSNVLAAAGEDGSSKTYKFQLYIGPKDKSFFDKNEQYKALGFVHTIDFMGCCCPASIIQPLAFGILALMKWMYGFIGNYGVVIVILVFLMRLIMHPITKKSQVSMSKMSKLGPKAEEIKKKYANNKTEMNKHMMALYREQGASPVMGFLPMMVQMPIWIALWSAVYASIDLRGAAFLPIWITDLSMPDALYRFPTALTVPLIGWKIASLNLLPIMMGVAFYLQQKLMPSQASASSNPQVAQQQKMMMVMMPLLFPLMLYNSPSGVSLYIMSSTFAGVIEQTVIRKHIREKEGAESKGLVAVTSKTGGKVKKKKPKPFFKT